MIVVDTNIIAYFYLHHQRSEMVEKVYFYDSAWTAPLLWRSEFCNILTLYLRRGWLNTEQARQILNEALFLMHNREYQVAPHTVLRLAAASMCSAYDCEFIALAQDLGVRLVTEDQQILIAFPATAISVEDYIEQAANL